MMEGVIHKESTENRKERWCNAISSVVNKFCVDQHENIPLGSNCDYLKVKPKHYFSFNLYVLFLPVTSLLEHKS